MFLKNLSGAEESPACNEAPTATPPILDFSPEAIAEFIYRSDTQNGRVDGETELREKVTKHLNTLFGQKLLKKVEGKQRLTEILDAVVPILKKKEEYDIAIDDSLPVSKDSVALAEDIIKKLVTPEYTEMWNDPFSNKHIDSAIEDALGPICRSENPVVKSYVQTLKNDTRREVIRLATMDGRVALSQDVIIDVAQQTFEPIKANLQQRNTQKAAVLSAFTGLMAIGYGSFAETINAAFTMGALAFNTVSFLITGWALLNIVNSMNKARLNRNFAKAAVANLSKLMTRTADFKVLLNYIATNMNNRYGYLVERYMKRSIDASLRKYARREREILKFPGILAKAERQNWSGKRFYEYLKNNKYELTLQAYEIKPSTHNAYQEMQAYYAVLKNKVKEVSEKMCNENNDNRLHAQELLKILKAPLAADGSTFNLLSVATELINANIVPAAEAVKKYGEEKRYTDAQK